MKTHSIFLAIGLGLILALMLPALVPRNVLAQTICKDATGKVIPCPDQPVDPGGNKKKPTPTRQRIFPTATPTATSTKQPTNTATATPAAVIPPAGGNDTSPGLTRPAPSASPFILIGLLLGLFIVAFIWFRNRPGNRGGERGFIINWRGSNSVGDPDLHDPPSDLGVPDTVGNPDLHDPPSERGVTMNNNETSMNNNEDGGSLTTNNE